MILHANWLPNSAVVSLWVENDEAARAGIVRSLPTKPGASPVHPFSLPGSALVSMLPEALELFSDERTLYLPSNGSCPLPSNGPIPAESDFVAWTVGTAETLAECFFEFVLHHDTDWAGEDLIWGPGLTYYHELARFARLLYETRAYAPGVVHLEGKIYPAWQAIFGEDAEAIWKRIVDAMPPCCRAIDDDDARQDIPSHLALSYADACIDALLRHRVKRQSPKQISLKKSSSPLHRQWINTLKYGQFQTLNGTASNLQQFSADVAAWTEFMRPSSFDVPWRLAFDVSPPEVELGKWHVQFVLASAKNPDNRITANQIWHDAPTRRYAPTAREILMAGLGQAIDVFPQIRESLQELDPNEVELPREDASEFMINIAPELRRSGFFVNLPLWWEDSNETLGLRLKIDAPGPSVQDRESFLGVDNLVDYEWDVALGDHSLTEEEFLELSQSKQHLIFRQGRWYRVDSDSLVKSIDILQKRGRKGRAKLNALLKIGTEIQRSGGLAILDIELDEYSFGGQMNQGVAFTALEQPKLFQGTMPPYQIHGFSWMVFMKTLGFGACLADDMGLGKTIQMIAVLVHDIARLPDYGPTLIVSPMSVVGNWAREIERFAPHLSVLVHHGTDRDSKEVFLASVHDYNVTISTYNLVVRDHECFRGLEWENIVLDEAQNIKNATTKQATVIRSLRSRHRFCLTGTPIENRLTELWSLMDFLNHGYLGSISNFRSTFSQPIERDQDATRAKTLQKIIRPFVLRRLKSDKDIVRDLPEKLEMKVFCNLTTEQAGLYQAVVDEMLSRIRNSHGIERKGLVLATLTKLKQITNHPVHFLRDSSPFVANRSGKLQRLEEMLEVVLDAGDKALIFSQFTEIGEAMRTRLQTTFGVEVLYLHGGTSKNQRDEIVHRFQSPNGPPLFLLSLKAGGVGLNLTAANHVFHFDRWWNPAIEDQATDRTYRIGQEKNVQVHKYICVGTVEEKIDHMIEEKKRLASDIVTAGENMLTELSTEELQEVFTLTRDAVVE